MSKDAKPHRSASISSSTGPVDERNDWRDLVEGAKVWARGGDRANYDAALADLSVTEEFHAIPAWF